MQGKGGQTTRSIGINKFLLTNNLYVIFVEN